MNEVAIRAGDAPDGFADACHEFTDAFYLKHGDGPAQEAMLRDPPEPTGNAFHDAWIGAMGEHLAQRWGLPVPPWTAGPAFNMLVAPVFVPESKALRGYLLVASPPGFRSRLIFTGSEPLQRARFPQAVKAVKVALRWPANTAKNIRVS